MPTEPHHEPTDPRAKRRAPTVTTRRLLGARIFRRFAKAESGAVTVDWVILTAALLGLAIVTLNVVGGGVSNASTDVRKCLNRQKAILLNRPNWDFDRKMRVVKRRCGRL